MALHGTMDFYMILSLVMIISVLACKHASAAFVCPKQIFAFGDSLTDTGNSQAENALFDVATIYPYGESYRFPDRPCERTRFSDGRLVIDYTAQAFKLPFLEPYSRKFDASKYTQGANFAYAGGTAQFSPSSSYPTFYLGREVDNYFDFTTKYPGAVGDVSTAMYIIPEIGGNDYTNAFIAGLSPADANAKLDDGVLAAIKQALERLHAGGARFFFIFNVPGVGCTPEYLTRFSDKSPKDKFGCLSAYNAVFQTLNKKLKAVVDTYRQMWPDTIILYYDYYSAVSEVIQNPNKYGVFFNGSRACCGAGGPYNYNTNPLLRCGTPIFGNVCPNPEKIQYWDEVHFTEGMNRVQATFALTGRFVDGPSETVNLKAACNLDFSSFNQIIPNPLVIPCL